MNFFIYIIRKCLPSICILNLRYPWVAVTIVGIWIAATYTTLMRSDADPIIILAITLITSLVLAILGFRTPEL